MLWNRYGVDRELMFVKTLYSYYVECQIKHDMVIILEFCVESSCSS
jgi:hypothetical protein